jgi:hypothetical protein
LIAITSHSTILLYARTVRLETTPCDLVGNEYLIRVLFCEKKIIYWHSQYQIDYVILICCTHINNYCRQNIRVKIDQRIPHNIQHHHYTAISITTAVLSLGPRKTKYTSKHTMSLEVSSGSNDEVANNRNMKSNQSLFETEKTRMLIMAK